MPMTVEERKIYNEKYYTANKKIITEKLLVKVECPLCHKYISKANLERHKIGLSCQRNSKQIKTEFDELKEQVAKLTKLLEEKSNDNI